MTRIPAARVLVVGAGAAGMAAAIAAARGGAEVLLLEKRATPGGTVVHSLIHTLGGLASDADACLNPGLACELAERLLRADADTRWRKIGKTWTLSVDPLLYGRITARWLDEAGVRVWCDAAVESVHTRGDVVSAVQVRDRAGTLQTVACDAVADCTGSAEVVRLLDPALVREEPERAAAGLIFQISGVEPAALRFPRNIGVLRDLQRAAAQGLLPEACGKAWIDEGVRVGEAYVKLFVPLTAGWRQPGAFAAMTDAALRWRDAVYSHLRGVPGFSAAVLGMTGEIGVRDGGRIEGQYLLNAEDVRQERRFADAACKCDWPVEYWHPETGVQLEYLPAGGYYEIPLAALRVRGYRNLWAAGKCLGADHLARASARVVGCCWGMGEAVGMRAAGVGETEHEHV